MFLSFYFVRLSYSFLSSFISLVRAKWVIQNRNKITEKIPRQSHMTIIISFINKMLFYWKALIELGIKELRVG